MTTEAIDLNCSLCNHQFVTSELNEAFTGETESNPDTLIFWYRCPDCGHVTGLEQ